MEEFRRHIVPCVLFVCVQVLEVCVKNCGAVIHRELATKEFMEFLKEQSVGRTSLYSYHCGVVYDRCQLCVTVSWCACPNV